MSLLALLSTAAALGLLGGLHCVMMCSAMQHSAIHGLGQARANPGTRRVWTLSPATAASHEAPHAQSGAAQWPSRTTAVPLSTTDWKTHWQFHAARLLGYAALGAAAGSSSAVLRWGAETLPLMRPIWAMLNGALLILGISLLITGRQPAWIDALGQRVWQHTGSRLPTERSLRPALTGLGWALMPCGLLYSALAIAVLASDPLRGALVMLSFGAGTVVHLSAARAVLQALLRRSATLATRLELQGHRVAGGALAAMAIAALVALAWRQPHPFC
jgi:sulfite exporter TauE/SafE